MIINGIEYFVGLYTMGEDGSPNDEMYFKDFYALNDFIRQNADNSKYLRVQMCYSLVEVIDGEPDAFSWLSNIQWSVFSDEQIQDEIDNFIEDENLNGDRKITNELELSMILGWMNSNNSDAKVYMPKSLNPEDDNVTIEEYKCNGETRQSLRLTIDKNTFIEQDERHYRYDFCVDDGSGEIDELTDKNNDGIADFRTKTKINNKLETVVYRDLNLDGKFDSKMVSKDNKEALFFNDTEGNWKFRQFNVNKQ